MNYRKYKEMLAKRVEKKKEGKKVSVIHCWCLQMSTLVLRYLDVFNYLVTLQLVQNARNLRFIATYLSYVCKIDGSCLLK